MITLITGAPGSGKSAALVQLLDEIAKDRQLYVDGIPDLKIPHTPLEDASKWPEVVPDGSAVVIDEVQRVWRPRGPGAKVPADIAGLETHRHRGLDFFIVTQGPRLVDANVRALVGRHVHLRDLGVLGRWWYEWPECSEGVAWKTAPIKKRYKLPKAIFEKYRSASMHIKPIRSFPMALVVMVLALVALAVLSYMGYRVIASKTEAVTAPAGTDKPSFATSLAAAVPKTAAEIHASFQPRFPNDPGSAPAYDAHREIVSVPRVVGGICVGSDCNCITQQGTDPGLSKARCYEWVRKRPFNPYLPEPEVPQQDQRYASVSARIGQ